MQAELAKAQEEIKTMTAEATAGGGMVKVVAQGDMTIQSIAIDPSAVDPDDVEMLQDIVTAAATRSAAAQGSQRISAATGGIIVDVASASWNRPAIQKLLDELERMPGVGPKALSASRIGMLQFYRCETVLRLADAIVEMKNTVHFCSRCFNYAEGELCEVCASRRRLRIGDMRSKRAARYRGRSSARQRFQACTMCLEGLCS